jgi:hypothetical protein
MRSAVETSFMTSRVHLIYNPYSIVKERWIAKIGVEHNARCALYSPLMLAARFRCFVLR